MALKFRIPSNRSLADGALYFYPDIFFHDFKKTDYLDQWHAVSAANTSYLVVVDGHLKPAGWIRYYFEQFKGWLGFTNNCAVEKVQMAAKKLAYYGYLNGFNDLGVLATISEWNDEYQPNSDYLQKCAQPRADNISAALQKQLIEFYSDHSDKLDEMNELGGCVIFGQSYQNEQDLSMVVQLDIQDKDLIDSILPDLKDPSTILKGSKFSKCYLDSQFTAIRERFAKLKEPVPGGFVSFLTSGWGAHNPASLGQLLLQLRVQADETLRLFPESKVDYVNILIELNLEIAKIFLEIANMFKDKDKGRSIEARSISLKAYEEALELQKTFSIQGDDLSFHIDNCIKFKKFPLAFELVERLFKFDEEKALRYLDGHEQEFCALVESNPTIRTACAARNALKGNKALSEYGLFDPSKKQLAQQFYQKAAALDRNIAVIISPAYYFKEYVDAGKWQEAFDLLQERKAKGSPINMLPKDSLNRLAQYYISQASTCYDNATVAATDALTPEDSCRGSIESIKKAVQVVNSDDNLMHLNSYKCRLAKILTKDEDEDPARIKDLARINEALDILKEIEKYPSIKKDSHLVGFKNLYIHLQAKKISFLHQGCLGASISAKSWGAEAEHKARCQDVLDDLLKHIDKQIRLLSDDEKQNYQQLAKLYFIKGDCIAYFDLDCGDPRACFKKACELEKNQPFYFFRYGQLLTPSSEYKASVDEKGKDLLEGTDLSELDYMHWYEERWRLHDDKYYKIHMPTPQKPALLAVQIPKPGWRLGFGW